MKLKAAIFDLDGTLLDSMGVWDNLSILYLNSQRISAPEKVKEFVNTMSLQQSAKYFKQEYRLPYSEDKICQQINSLIEEEYYYSISPKKGAVPFLNLLKQKNVKMCIATATDKYLVTAALKRLNLLTCFEFILTCSEVGCGKDKPLIYEKALTMLNEKKEDTIVFEDALYAAQTAKNAGFIVAGVYDKSAKEQTEQMKKICNYYAENLVELEWIAQ